jgi:hypothetical protein
MQCYPTPHHFSPLRSKYFPQHPKSCDSSIVIALGYGLDNWGSRVRSSAGAGNFFSLPPPPERLGGPPSFLSNGYQKFFLWGYNGRGREADHLPPSSSEVKNAWSCTSTPPVRLHGVVLS